MAKMAKKLKPAIEPLANSRENAGLDSTRRAGIGSGKPGLSTVRRTSISL
jgi:hypothetical protein